jgi:uncharacterized protein
VDKIKLEILGLSSSSQSQSGSFALVLGEVGGNRRLPIIIGMFEAQAIAIEIEKIVPNRPMTHDLFKSFSHEFGFRILEIVITDLREGVFFARIVCDDGQKVVEVDSRPSDAIAIGLRFNAPIYTYETVLSEAGVVLSEESEEEEPEAEVKKESPAAATPPKTSPERMKDFPVEKLRQMLDEAIQKEDYERAAKIRDELNKRN